MDADRGGRTGNEKKRAWPDLTSRPPAGQDEDAVPAGIPDGSYSQEPFTAAAPPPPAAEVTGPPGPRPGGGIAALSLPYQVVAALALSVIGLVACGHLAMIFLHVAPSNTLTKQHGEVVDDWVYPEFEQNWKLFAPNPLQQNISVQVRAEVFGADGRDTTRWINLSRQDGDEIRGNLLPSHVDQNELRRAWDFYTGSHDSENRPNGLRGELSETYIRRIVMLRLAERDYGGTVQRIQVRSATRSVGAPPWSDEKISTRPDYRVLPWWTITPSDLPETAGADGSSESPGGEAEK
ncbi:MULTISPECIES: DUF5819 family protein [unclassified Streptomyces]|uniref:DUF5819 family protein n=1 Tax=unclassified Streptomyces TaxID=2593676 RepID=UPI00093ABC0A|nr:DUF5819 family protein [Streptomyces sp. CB02058]OKI91836.1 hypothetical protein AMK10_26590 [Streptomyces sp. CB02058]